MQIIIVKLGALGDLAYAKPALRYLKAARPEAAIDWLVTEELAEFLRGDPSIRSIKTIRGQDLYRGNILAKAMASLNSRNQLDKKYDLILLFHRDPKFLALVLGKGPIVMPVRTPMAFIMPTVKPVYCAPLTYHESLALKRVTDAGLRLVDPQRPLPSETEWDLTPGEKKTSLGRAKILGVHLGGGKNVGRDFILKRWPLMRAFIEYTLLKTDLTIRLVGGAEEKEEALEIRKTIPPNHLPRIENLVGETKIANLSSKIRECDIFLGPDSGPLHIADAIGVPAIGIYGPTSPISWGLRGNQSQSLFMKDLPCRPCYKDDGYFPPCSHEHRCMKFLSVEKVFAEIKSRII